MIHSRRFAIALWLATSLRAASAASAQASTLQQCVSELAAPTRDSITLNAVLSVRAANAVYSLPPTYQLDFADAVRRRLRLPTPLTLDAYQVDVSAPTAHLALWGLHEITMTSAGQVSRAVVTAGARNEAFDAAVLSALRAIDSTDVVSAAVEGVPGDLRLRVQVSTRPVDGAAPLLLDSPRSYIGRQSRTSNSVTSAPIDSALIIPLFLLRLPSLSVRRDTQQQPGTGVLHYPVGLRSKGIQGEAVGAFVIGSDGLAEQASFYARRATHPNFAQAVEEALSSFRFTPLVIGGCAVRSIVQQPFTFTLAPMR
jgi:hypothetical protein